MERVDVCYPRVLMKKIFPLFVWTAVSLHADVVGIEEFDYPDGTIEALTGGVGWDYDRSTEFDDNGVEPGPDGDASDWDVLEGSASVVAGALVTSDSSAKREYNGLSEGATPASEERDGAFRGVGVIYYRVDMTRSSDATWSGISGYDFGGERIYFGVSSENAGTGLVSIQETGVGGVNGTTVLADNQTYRLIAKIDFDNDLLSMWVDPDISLDESSNPPEVTRAYTGTNWNTAVRCGSGGEVTWDNLAVTTEWWQLDFEDDDNDGMPNWYENRYGLNPGVDDADEDEDLDTISNLNEFLNGTIPNKKDSDDDGLDDNVEDGGGLWVSETQTGTDPLNPDSDSDALLDGVEDNGGSFVSESKTGTDPNEPDTDLDGSLDGTEVLCGSDPTNGASIPDSGNLDFVGSDFFFYENGSIAGASGGQGFDYDNDLAGSAFTGHNCIESIWTGSGVISGGLLQTRETNAFRPLAGTSLLEGRFNTDETISNRQTLYAKVKMTRRSGASWSGLSFYSGTGNEVLFFGANQIGMDTTFTIVDQEVVPGTNYRGAVPIEANDEETYVLVAKIEHDPAGQEDGIEASLFVNPDLGQAEPTADLSQLLIPTAIVDTNTIRLASGGVGIVEWGDLVLGTTWEALEAVPEDADADGLPDEWERANGLTVGINDAGDNADTDGLTNLEEYENRTDPQNGDSDGDTLLDDFEVNSSMTNPNEVDTDGDSIRDDEEITEGADGYVTDPNLADTDLDGADDAREVENGSDPTDPNDRFGGDWSVIGYDDFSDYDGLIANTGGGVGFDFDSSPENGTFLGHTETSSLWNDEGVGGATVENGVLVTMNNGASREFNGPTEGAGGGADERMGAVNEAWYSNVLYMRVTMTRRNGATTSRFGSDDFGNFRHAFGVFDSGSGPEWGISVDGTNTTTVASEVNEDQPYTLVAKVDYPGDSLTLWVDPNLNDLEGNNTPMHMVTYPNTNWASAIQFGSEGVGATEWDDVVVAREWEALNRSFTPEDPIITDYDFDVASNQVTLTWSSRPGVTYRIENSGDLFNWNDEQIGISSGGASTTRNVTILVGPPQRLFYRVVEETP